MKRLLFVLFLISSDLIAQTGTKVLWMDITTDTKASFRGLSVVDDRVAWLGGSKGTVGITTDGGKTWRFRSLEGYETLDFRSIYAFNEKTAIIANAGSPAYILKTTDGGQSWRRVYQNDDKDAFIDGIDFWDGMKGVVYGDPMGSNMLLLKTTDGGDSWALSPDDQRPLLKEGEASFAASGTGIKCLPKGNLYILTGGKSSRLWVSRNEGVSWSTYEMPIIQGGQMTGGYSMAFRDRNKGIVVGGNWDDHSLTTDHIVLTDDGGKTWYKPTTPTRGLRECVTFLSDNILVASGQKGSDVSYDGGKTWSPLSDLTGFDVVRKARKGNLIVAAGGQGKVALLNLVGK